MNMPATVITSHSQFNPGSVTLVGAGPGDPELLTLRGARLVVGPLTRDDVDAVVRAGLATAGQQLPIQATLIDGGQNKNPSPTYTDILTVTITPLAYAITGTDNCGSFTVP